LGFQGASRSGSRRPQRKLPTPPKPQAPPRSVQMKTHLSHDRRLACNITGVSPVSDANAMFGCVPERNGIDEPWGYYQLSWRKTRTDCPMLRTRIQPPLVPVTNMDSERGSSDETVKYFPNPRHRRIDPPFLASLVSTYSRTRSRDREFAPHKFRAAAHRAQCCQVNRPTTQAPSFRGPSGQTESPPMFSSQLHAPAPDWRHL
jgi:hypothetical protein